MSKVKLIESGGRYVGTKMKDVLKKIKHRQSAAKSKKNIEKIGRGTKSISRYNIRARDAESKIIPTKAQSQKGSSFKTVKIRTRGPSTYHVNKMGSSGSAESLREDLMRTHGYGPSFNELIRSITKKRKAKGGMLKLKYVFGTEGIDIYMPGSGVLFKDGIVVVAANTSVTITHT